MMLLDYFMSLLLLTLWGKMSVSGNIPCNLREAVAGYICVCNATYCDTIERPLPLPRGSYYHYSTSATSPGFSVTTGTVLDTSSAASGSPKDVLITVDSTTQYQTFEGFGASMTVSAGTMINSLPPEAKQKFIESYFGVSGLEYNMVRVPVASSDFSLRYYCYDDIPGDVDLKYFNLTEDDLQLKIPILLKATNTSKRGLKLIGSTWTAPDWMKTNNNYGLGYIYNKYLGVWANYYLKFLQAYKQHGLEFWGLTQGNEVNIGLLFGPWLPIPNTLFPPLVARYWTKKYLGPLLRSSGFGTVKLLAMDDERPFLTWYMDRMLADEDAAQYIDGVALHFYLDKPSNIHNLQDFHDKHPDKFLLYTEASLSSFNSPGAPVELGSWDRAQVYIESILTNLDHWVVGYIDWNIALNGQGGPTGPAGLFLDAAVIINETNGEFYKQPSFYAVGHFSKFLSPGSKKINATISQHFADESFHEFDGTKAVRGPGGSPRVSGGPPPPTGDPIPTFPPPPPSTTVSALASLNPDGSITVIAYNPRSEPVNIIITDPDVGVLNRTVDARSLNTFIYW